MPRWLPIIALLPLLLADRSLPAQDLTPEMVRRSIGMGVEYLQKEQHPRNGDWAEYTFHSGGVTALCTLALINSGVKQNDPAVQKALVSLRDVGLPRGSTYATAMQTMAFAAADPERDRLLIERNARYLEAIQIRGGPSKGGWGYGDASVTADNSNSQFALLALYEAERSGVKVNDQTWRLAMKYWADAQDETNGFWRYQSSGYPPTGSMTCAGIASMIIASDTLNTGEAVVTGDSVRCCGEQDELGSIAKGFGWLDRNFRVDSNPSPLSRLVGENTAFPLYYLYALERVGRLSGRRYIGGNDWYRAGAAELIKRQDKVSGFWQGIGPGESEKRIGTALALLFLAKGRRPVVIARLEHGEGEDWNHHRAAMQNLTRDVERRWQQDMTWQTVDVRAAAPEELLQAPVLFLSGSQPLDFTAEQKENLKTYVNEGGFIFAEAACGSRDFDASFRALMKELFPDSSLRALPPDHPVWYAEQRVALNALSEGTPLFGVDACCRTSVVYSPRNLSCYWELNRQRAAEAYPAKVQAEIDAIAAIGANVLAYATNRELRDKLEVPTISLADAQNLPRRTTIVVAKINHSGGADDAPNAWSNLLRHYKSQSAASVSPKSPLLAAGDPQLMQHPIAFMHGRRSFRFSVAERKALAEYVERGGFIFADAICGTDAFARSFREEMAAVFPDHPLERIPPEHPIFTDRYRGHAIETTEIRDPQAAGGNEGLTAAIRKVKPLLEGIQIDGRYVVVFSPYDLSCALENSTSAECEGYTRTDAYRVGMNVLLYALQE